MKQTTLGRSFLIAFGLIATLSFTSCGGEDAPDTTTGAALNLDTISDQATTEKLEHTRKIFYSIPSPVEMASILRKAGAEYDFTVLNDVKNKDKYNTTQKQALNLGVFGADMSYSSIYNQNQETMWYMAASKQLADELGVLSAFDASTIERIETNIEDRDSMMRIISETFWVLDEYFKDNDRHELSAMIVVGGWIEGLYLTTALAQGNPTDELRQRIADQKYPLNDLVSLLQSYEDSDELQAILNDVKDLQASFDKIEVVKGNTTAETDPDSGITVIGGGDQLSIDDATLAEITEKAAALRNRYIE